MFPTYAFRLCLPDAVLDLWHGIFAAAGSHLCPLWIDFKAVSRSLTSGNGLGYLLLPISESAPGGMAPPAGR